MVYLHADHNLDPSAVADLEEMKKVGSSKDFNIVFQLDRKAVAGITRGLVKAGDLEVVQSFTDEQVDGDDPGSLRDFLEWGIKTYPANRYGVVLWDHGGQWDGGFGGDETRPGGKPKGGLTPTHIRDALKTAMDAQKVSKLEFLSYDTCLMGGVELLLEYADLAKLYIANPELDYGDGWEYTPTLQYLKDNPTADMLTFGQKEAEFWQAHHSAGQADLRYRAHTIYNLDGPKLEALRTAWREFTALVQPNPAFFQARRTAIEYNFSNKPSDLTALRNYVDLGDLANKAKALDATLAPKADALIAALNGVVVTKVLGERNQGALGLSIWMPNDRSQVPAQEVLDAYNKLLSSTSTNSAWHTALGPWFNAITANTAAPNIAAAAGATGVKTQATVSFSVSDGDANDTASIFALAAKPESATRTLIYGHILHEAKSEGNFNADWDGKWWQISDGSTSLLASGLQIEPGDPTLYLSGLYTPPGQTEANPVAVLLDPATSKIIAVLDTEGISPNEIDLQAGGKLELNNHLFNPTNSSFSEEASGVVLTIGNTGLASLTLSKVDVPKGTYAILGGATDWVGNDAYASQSVTFN